MTDDDAIEGFEGRNAGIGDRLIIRPLSTIVYMLSLIPHLTLPTNVVGCRSRWSPYH
jgi:hypothetical protein